MATSKTRSAAPVEAPVEEAAPVAPSAPSTGLFNMPRIVAKPVKPVPVAEAKRIYVQSEGFTLSGVQRTVREPDAKAKPAFKSIEDALK